MRASDCTAKRMDRSSGYLCPWAGPFDGKVTLLDTVTSVFTTVEPP